MYLPTFLVSSLAVKNTADRLELTGRPMIFSDLRHKVADLRHVWGQVPLQPAPSTTTNPTAWTEYALDGLDQWYNCTTGIWETAGWWNSANVMTMLGNLAKADPYNEHVQIVARRTFANAIRNAPIKNPVPNVERPNVTSPTSTSRSGTPFSKYIDPRTYLPYSNYPIDWFRHIDSATNTIGLLTGDSKYDEGSMLKDFKPDPYDWLDGFYDDDLWWALAWINAYDVTSRSVYLTLAKDIFDIVAKGWGTNCSSGGIYWNDSKQYVNAIANELFFSTAAHLANRAQDTEYYTDWAKKSLDWFVASGMINENNTVNDGLDAATCKNNNGTVWSYNQGVILGGLVELNHASPNSTLLPLASTIAGAALKKLSDEDSIIKDVCDDGGTCGADGTQFKGIYMRNLGELWAATGNTTFGDAIKTNAKSIWRNDKEVQEDGVVFGNRWAGPFEGPANASMQGSAMDALVANLVVSI
ncbi:mannan endo-1,6-alpha-mannosidase [Parastagonospora nodorum]|nr:mannan endo-1,6-alpha-mannosidase [Parastagonospora nodorum]